MINANVCVNSRKKKLEIPKTSILDYGLSTVVITFRIWVFDMYNALNKIDTFIPQLIPLFRGVYPDSAAPNLSRHVI